LDNKLAIPEFNLLKKEIDKTCKNLLHNKNKLEKLFLIKVSTASTISIKLATGKHEYKAINKLKKSLKNGNLYFYSVIGEMECFG
jgi:hypothetical protein